MDVIDEGRYSELVADFELEGAREVLGTFLDTTPAQVQAVVEARDAGDVEALASAAHRLRGGALIVGAGELDRVASLVESAARDGAVAPEAARIEAVWDATAAALQARR